MPTLTGLDKDPDPPASNLGSTPVAVPPNGTVTITTLLINAIVDIISGDHTSKIPNDALDDIALAKVIGLVAALAGKASLIHTHSFVEITDFNVGVSTNGAVIANTAKVTNATHTGEVTGSGALVLDKSAITGKAPKTTPVAGDQLLLSDSEDSDNLKKMDFASLLASADNPTFIRRALVDDAVSTSVVFTTVIPESGDPAIIIPANKNYIVIFYGSMKNAVAGNCAQVQLFVGGVQFGEGFSDNTVASIPHFGKTGGAAEDVEIMFRSCSGVNASTLFGTVPATTRERAGVEVIYW